MRDGGSRGSQQDDQKQGAPCGTKVARAFFELGAMAASLVREAFLSFLLATFFVAVITSHVDSLVELAYPTKCCICLHLWIALGHDNKTSSKHGI